ncbi:hypothetical protein HMPREF9141_2204 [Prevotella multiformis DSM 16608]|uniref:Uncharacterized protein n=1 Tax=Prevotella multiformis DSM 16608 TaxID=888743 RepID=F0F9D7_9BACT|nr:hypothetical protein HMPREF9141_2204 [Prevotella multiformis DSM 16608]
MKLCNGFSKPYLSFQRIKMKRSLYQVMMTEQAVVGLAMFLLNEPLRFFR